MGRELKRVPLDFDWPWERTTKQGLYGHGVWPGYLFHHPDACEWDDEQGYSCGKSWHEKVDPPAGEGYQLWETTSGGSPISPPFATLDDLCEWAALNSFTFGDYRTTAAEWKRMLEDGLVTTVIGPGMIAL